ncbi:MAG: hypothetical protein ABI366_04355 [Ginsengibacter sp.]
MTVNEQINIFFVLCDLPVSLEIPIGLLLLIWNHFIKPVFIPAGIMIALYGPFGFLVILSLSNFLSS